MFIGDRSKRKMTFNELILWQRLCKHFFSIPVTLSLCFQVFLLEMVFWNGKEKDNWAREGFCIY